MEFTEYIPCYVVKVGKTISNEYRIYKEEGLHLRSKRPRRNKAAAHRMERPDIHRKDQIWSMDFVSDNLFNGNRIRFLTVVDNFSRKCLTIRAGKSLRGTDVVKELNPIVSERTAYPERI